MISFQNFLPFSSIEIDRDVAWRIVEHDLPHLKPQIDAEVQSLKRAELSEQLSYFHQPDHGCSRPARQEDPFGPTCKAMSLPS